MSTIKCKQCNKVPIIFITSELEKKYICFCRFVEVDKTEKAKLPDPLEIREKQTEEIRKAMKDLEAKIKKNIDTSKFTEVPQMYEQFDILREIYYA